MYDVNEGKIFFIFYFEDKRQRIFFIFDSTYVIKYICLHHIWTCLSGVKRGNYFNKNKFSPNLLNLKFKICFSQKKNLRFKKNQENQSIWSEYELISWLERRAYSLTKWKKWSYWELGLLFNVCWCRFFIYLFF